jgi:hypothetical protein
MPQAKRIKWCVPVTATLDSALEKAVSEETHSSKSEFVRDAVRRRQMFVLESDAVLA